MSEPEITLKDMFPTAVHGLSKGMMAAIVSSGQVREVQAKVMEQAKNLHWQLILKEVWGKVPELLDIKLVNIFSGAFNKAKELQKYTDQSKYPPDQEILAHLAEHTLKSLHHPSVEIYVNDRFLGKFVFDVTVALALKGLVLKIQDSRVKAVSPGSCQAEGTIALEKAVLVERKLSPLTLPNLIDLGEGVNLKG